MIFLDPNAFAGACDFHYEKLAPIISQKLQSNKPNLPSNMKRYIKEHLEVVLKGLPQDLLSTDEEFKQFFRVSKRKKKELIGRLKQIIDYDWFVTKREKKYDAYDLAAKLDVRTCTYCNRLYTITVLNGTTPHGHVTRPQFDHYFSKSQFPLLALSFYNLIPSCVICNSTFKRDKEFDLDNYIHPYIDNCNQLFSFSYTPQNTSSAKGAGSDHKIKINFSPNIDALTKKKVINTLALFRISETYNGHLEEVSDLLRIRQLMTDQYLATLKKTYDLSISDDELYRLAFGTYRQEEDFVKRPFSKLKKDILRELEII